MVADLAKQVSDDDTLTYRHIAFLLNIYRAYLLKQKYLNKAQEIPSSNYQTICAKVEPTNSGSAGNPCCNSKCNPDSSYMLKSSNKGGINYGNHLFKAQGLLSSRPYPSSPADR